MDEKTTVATAQLAPEAFAERAQTIEREVGKVIVGQRRPRAPDADVPAGQWPRAARRRARSRQDDARPDLARRHRSARSVAIQFTPDLMPADIIGTNILIEDEAASEVFRFQPGPIFANLVLADEINRATPKTQSALLEAMQEHRSRWHGRRCTARCAVLRARDAEPARDGGHLPAARGAARPVPVQGAGPVPLRGGPDLDHGPDDRLRPRHREQGLHRGARSSRCSGSPAPSRSLRT